MAKTRRRQKKKHAAKRKSRRVRAPRTDKTLTGGSAENTPVESKEVTTTTAVPKATTDKASKKQDITSKSPRSADAPLSANTEKTHVDASSTDSTSGPKIRAHYPKHDVDHGSRGAREADGALYLPPVPGRKRKPRGGAKQPEHLESEQDAVRSKDHSVGDGVPIWAQWCDTPENATPRTMDSSAERASSTDTRPSLSKSEEAKLSEDLENILTLLDEEDAYPHADTDFSSNNEGQHICDDGDKDGAEHRTLGASENTTEHDQSSATAIAQEAPNGRQAKWPFLKGAMTASLLFAIAGLGGKYVDTEQLTQDIRHILTLVNVINGPEEKQIDQPDGITLVKRDNHPLPSSSPEKTRTAKRGSSSLYDAEPPQNLSGAGNAVTIGGANPKTEQKPGKALADKTDPATQDTDQAVVKETVTTSSLAKHANTKAPSDSLMETSAPHSQPLRVEAAHGAIGRPVGLIIAITEADDSTSKRYFVKLEGLPDQALLSAGTYMSGGTWMLRKEQLNGLTLSLDPHFHGKLSLTATLYSPAEGAISSLPLDITISVAGPGPISAHPLKATTDATSPAG